MPPPPTIEELRTRFAREMAELRENLKPELSQPQNQRFDNEIWLLRYLLNPKYSVAQCAERYRKMIATREKDGVNEILARLEAEGGTGFDIKRFPHFEVVNRAFPEALWHTTDIYGQPVAVSLLGRCEPKSLVSSLTKDEFYEYAKYKAEYMRMTVDALSERSGKLLQWVQVIDLDGLGMKHMHSGAMDVMKSASNRIDQMYKECLGKILVVNAPRVFHMIWAMVKLWLNERTAVKVTLLGASFKTDLVEYIPKEGLPHFLGGSEMRGAIAYVQFDADFGKKK